jgi:hypothetical protein
VDEANSPNNREFHPKAFSDISAKLEGGPFFVPPYIEFVIGVYSKDQDGAIPAEEWYIDQAGKAGIRASFVSDGFSWTWIMAFYLGAKNPWRVPTAFAHFPEARFLVSNHNVTVLQSTVTHP